VGRAPQPGPLPAPRAGRIGNHCKLTTVTTGFNSRPSATPKLTAMWLQGEPLHCAVAFALEGRRGLLVEQIGCFSNSEIA